MNKLGIATGFFAFWRLFRFSVFIPVYWTHCMGTCVCVCACGFLMNREMLMVVKQWFLQLIGCNGWYSELLHNWWGCLVDALMPSGSDAGVCVCVCWSSKSWVGPATPEKSASVFFYSSSYLFLLTEARSTISIMHDCLLQGKNGVRFLHRIERNQMRNLIVCKRKMRWLNLCFSYLSVWLKKGGGGITELQSAQSRFHWISMRFKWIVHVDKWWLWTLLGLYVWFIPKGCYTSAALGNISLI